LRGGGPVAIVISDLPLMSRKTLIAGRPAFIVLFTVLAAAVRAEEAGDGALLDRILGNASCATSGCHGGAGPVHGVTAAFLRADPHARAFATLATPRSARMGEALGIADVRTSVSCTACHAPAANVPEALRGADLEVADGVGCASCHESTGRWLRTHTRPELSHAEKVAAGMRDLGSPLARADACVACHQVIEPRLVETGRHPRLIFELDGQLAAEPPHWRATQGWDGAKAWFIGQAVAWREIAAARASGSDTLAGAAERERALEWLVRRAGGEAPDTRLAPDAVAHGAEMYWTREPGEGAAMLQRLAAVGGDFRDASVSRLEQAYRAERLVLGLDRLLAAWPERARATAAGPALDKLFAAAHSVPDFEPVTFAGLLEVFSVAAGFAEARAPADPGF